MKRYSKEKVIREKEILVKTSCDQCRKEIPKNAHYYEVTTGHRDWGMDSPRDNKDICSDECLTKELNEFLKESSHTKYIEIEREKNVLEDIVNEQAEETKK